MNLLEVVVDDTVDLLQEDIDLDLAKRVDVVDTTEMTIITVDEKIAIAMKIDIEMITENHEEDKDLEVEAQVMNKKKKHICYLALMKMIYRIRYEWFTKRC
jgi:hypothetical protein